MPEHPENLHAYPADHSFIVQIEAHSAISPESLRGRAEHMLSGQACKFDSLPQLLEFIRRTIQSQRDGE